MNRARELAVRKGLAIVEQYQDESSGHSAKTPPLGIDLNGVHLEQSKLDVIVRTKTSRLPWRGQFPPELVGYFLETVCRDSQFVFDPFCGSGTVLFEAIVRGRVAVGSEVNPAAWHLANLASFAGLTSARRRSILDALQSIATTNGFSGGLFNATITADTITKLICSDETEESLAKYLAALILLGMRDEVQLNDDHLYRGAVAALQILTELSNIATYAECHLEDARQTSLNDGSVDAIITSPPYINVFNYHQNYRSAVELLGWHPLEAAPSEIGANRKHRANRFLTVVQYCLDMIQCLNEMARVLKPGGPVVIVLGRTSNVLGAPFANGRIFSQLLSLSGSFGPVRTEERVFTNRFGDRIFEDILITHKVRSASVNFEDAREIGVLALTKARNDVIRKNRSDLEDAIKHAGDVRPSPFLKLHFPHPFKPSRSQK
jgi:SAM-dependent methyltransferase